MFQKYTIFFLAALLALSLIYNAVQQQRLAQMRGELAELLENSRQESVVPAPTALPTTPAATDDDAVSVLRVELTALRREHRELRETLFNAHRQIAQISSEREQMAGELEDVLRPLGENIRSSTLKTTVRPDETLLTGGFPGDDGERLFAAVKPTPITLEDGRKAIRVDAHLFSVLQEKIAQAGLDSLSTNAGNVLQHGELWNTEAVSPMTSEHSAQRMNLPSMYLLPGNTGRIQMGQHTVRVTASESSSGEPGEIDLDLRLELPGSDE